MKKNGSAVCEFFVFFFAHYYLEDRSAGRVVGGFTNILAWFELLAKKSGGHYGSISIGENQQMLDYGMNLASKTSVVYPQTP